ncbi:hypothetical protein VPH35_049816 [Triticum aestivum]
MGHHGLDAHPHCLTGITTTRQRGRREERQESGAAAPEPRGREPPPLLLCGRFVPPTPSWSLFGRGNRGIPGHPWPGHAQIGPAKPRLPRCSRPAPAAATTHSAQCRSSACRKPHHRRAPPRPLPRPRWAQIWAERVLRHPAANAARLPQLLSLKKAEAEATSTCFDLLINGHGWIQAPLRASSRTSLCKNFDILFLPAEPPAISRFYIRWPDDTKSEDAKGTKLVAAHRDLVLFMQTSFGRLDKDGRLPIIQDHFICVASCETKPSLQLKQLPICNKPMIFPFGEGEEKAMAEQRLFFPDTVGLIRGHGESVEAEFAVAQLAMVSEIPGSLNMEAEVCVFLSLVSGNDGDGKWDVRKIPIDHKEDEHKELYYWSTDAVITFNSCICWISYYRGDGPWDEHVAITSEELWALNRYIGLLCDILMFPLVSMLNSNIAYFLVSESAEEEKSKVSLVTIQLSTKKVLVVHPYILREEGSPSGPDADMIEEKSHLLRSFISSRFPRVLKTRSWCQGV